MTHSQSWPQPKENPATAPADTSLEVGTYIPTYSEKCANAREKIIADRKYKQATLLTVKFTKRNAEQMARHVHPSADCVVATWPFSAGQ